METELSQFSNPTSADSARITMLTPERCALLIELLEEFRAAVADIASDPQPDEKLTRDGRIRSVSSVTETHVEYYRSSIEVPWLQHRKRCTRAGWANWAEGAERWEA